MQHPRPNAVVHLELHTGRLGPACEFYAELFGWRARWLPAGDSSYLSLGAGERPSRGAVECGVDRPLWLPYVEVGEIAAALARAEELGARTLLAPREGPLGWRSVVAAPCAGEVALWQPKR